MCPWPEKIETERLTLVFPAPADAPEIFERYAQDAEVTRFLSWTPHGALAKTQEFVQRAAALREAGSDIGWLIRERATGRLLGSVGLRPSGTKVEMGFCLARDAWGQGFAVEAARAVISLAFQDPAIWRVQALCDVENTRSQRVLEKLGMAREGILRRYSVHPTIGPEPRDVFCYAITRDEL